MKQQLLKALEEVKFVITSIPEGFPMPDINNMEYEVGFDIEWFGNKRHTLGVEVKGNERFMYSYIAGENSAHGTSVNREYFIEELEKGLRAVFPDNV